MSTAAPGPAANRLLANLPDHERQHLLTRADTVTLSFGEVLAQAGEPLAYVYFPTASFISMITVADGRPRLEVGLAGDEGMLGASLMLEVDRSPTQAVVQGEGEALRMSTQVFRHELNASPELQQVLKHYLYVQIAQLGQTAACTRYHRLEARLARWLLMTRDRAHSDTFLITHEFLAYMLGVRRVGITEAANEFQNRGLIRYHRGHLAILDREGLEAAACGCYAADCATYRETME